MSLITCCPSCATRFRVVPDQLRISDGWVRCGRCQEVFDAAAALQEQQEAALAAPQPAVPPPPAPATEAAPAPDGTPLPGPEFFPQPEPEPQQEPEPESVPEPEPEPEPVAKPQPEPEPELQQKPAPLPDPEPQLEPEPELQPEPSPEPAPRPEPFMELELEPRLLDAPSQVPDGVQDLTEAFEPHARDPLAGALPVAPVVPPLPPAAPRTEPVLDVPAAAVAADDDADDDDLTPAPSFVRQAQRRARWNQPWLRALVGLLCVLLPLALALQYVVYQRDSLAAQNPALRPALSGLCAALGCTIAAPQNIGMVVVAGSAFNQETAPGRYRLGLSVRNQASSIVATPALELTLTDASDQPLVRKIFLPAELGMPPELGPRAEWNGTLPMQVQALPQPISGYRMELFYP